MKERINKRRKKGRPAFAKVRGGTVKRGSPLSRRDEVGFLEVSWGGGERKSPKDGCGASKKQSRRIGVKP